MNEVLNDQLARGQVQQGAAHQGTKDPTAGHAEARKKSSGLPGKSN